jgi:hypothetical protein
MHPTIIPLLVPRHRWLHPDDPLRAGYGPDLPPPARTHAQACQDAKDSEADTVAWKNKKHVRYTNGVNYWSPLSVLMMFDMIWDFCPDMMHIIKTFFERLTLGVFGGTRSPTFKMKEPSKPMEDEDGEAPARRAAKAAAREKYKQKKKHFDTQKALHASDVEASVQCTFDEATRRVVDNRVKNLIGFPEWIKASLV